MSRQYKDNWKRLTGKSRQPSSSADGDDLVKASDVPAVSSSPFIGCSNPFTVNAEHIGRILRVVEDGTLITLSADLPDGFEFCILINSGLMARVLANLSENIDASTAQHISVAGIIGEVGQSLEVRWGYIKFKKDGTSWVVVDEHSNGVQYS